MCLKEVSKEMNEHMHRILEINNVSLHLNMSVYFDLVNLCIDAHKEISLNDDYLKGK